MLGKQLHDNSKCIYLQMHFEQNLREETPYFIINAIFEHNLREATRLFINKYTQKCSFRTQYKGSNSNLYKYNNECNFRTRV